MTKEECQEACQTLMCGCSSEEAYEKSCSIIEQLIEEHFDNPPLSYDELEVGTWVWDDEMKEWIKILSLVDHEETLIGDDVCYSDKTIGTVGARFGYEDNRFYRKQVENDV